jgi:hypothetical protein
MSRVAPPGIQAEEDRSDALGKAAGASRIVARAWNSGEHPIKK